MDAEQELIPTRRSLLSRLRDWNHQESWKDFFDMYWKLIYAAAIHGGLTDAEAQDVVQETVISVAKNIAEFRYDPARGSFKAWLLNLTRWRIIDQLRKRQTQSGASAGYREVPLTPEMDQVLEPQDQGLETHWDEEWRRNAMEVATERVKLRVDPKLYQAFDLYAFKEWPASKVAKHLNLNIAQVYLTKHRIARLLKTEIAAFEERVC